MELLGVGLFVRRAASQDCGQTGNELVVGRNYLFSQCSVSFQCLSLTGCIWKPEGKEIQVVRFLRSISQAIEQDIESGRMDLGRQMENNQNRKKRFTPHFQKPWETELSKPEKWVRWSFLNDDVGQIEAEVRTWRTQTGDYRIIEIVARKDELNGHIGS